jgi:molecular chaperone GrpE
MEDSTKKPEQPLDDVQSAHDSIDPATDSVAPEMERDVEAEIQELKDQNLRLYAEFENFRRRNARERLELMGTSHSR